MLISYQETIYTVLYMQYYFIALNQRVYRERGESLRGEAQKKFNQDREG